MRAWELLEFRVRAETGEDIQVLKNPRRLAILSAYRKWGELRGLQSGKDFFFWPASQEIHARMAEKIGIPYENDRRLGIVKGSYGVRLDFDEVHWLELLNNRYIQSVFDIDDQDEIYIGDES